jgi:hypothetical protein
MELIFLTALIVGIMVYLHPRPAKAQPNDLEAAYAEGYEAGVRTGMIEVARALHRAALEDVPPLGSKTKGGTSPPSPTS